MSHGDFLARAACAGGSAANESRASTISDEAGGGGEGKLGSSSMSHIEPGTAVQWMVGSGERRLDEWYSVVEIVIVEGMYLRKLNIRV